MKILAIDTTENTASCAVTEDERLLGMATLAQTKTHSESMLPTVKNLLDALKLTVDSVDLFACAAGPGSFTGVRIGVATIKGLAFGRNKPTIGVSALESMAWALRGFRGVLCPGMDARRGQLYQAFFLSDGENITRLTPDRVVMAEDLKSELLNDERMKGKDLFLCGGGYLLMKKALADYPALRFTPEQDRYENGYGVALCAYYHSGEATSDLELKPIYLRASQAEREREEKLAEETKTGLSEK